MKDLKHIVDQFDIKEKVENIKPFGEGLINDTYLVTCADSEMRADVMMCTGTKPAYVLQRINHNVFKDVEGMQRNIKAVTAHIRKKLTASGEVDIERKVLDFVRTKDSGKTYYFDGENYWRLSRYIADTVTLSEVTPLTAKAAGREFGRFQRLLADIEEPLVESIPDFHNMEFRLKQLQEAVAGDAVGRVKEVKDILEEISKRAEWLTEPERMYRERKLPKRICHCDTKVNNMLFDENGEALCVIDLDTVMPSFIFSDFGDFLRTGACTTPEDEPQLDKIDFDMSIFKAFAEGYLSEGRKFLIDAEIAWLPDAVALFPYMQAVRFLTDYINGDTYYKIKYPDHNLIRTKAQLQLLKAIERLLPQIRHTLKEL